jgi:hypothetical protein
MATLAISCSMTLSKNRSGVDMRAIAWSRRAWGWDRLRSAPARMASSGPSFQFGLRDPFIHFYAARVGNVDLGVALWVDSCDSREH